MGVTFTKEQQQVIDLRDRNILVSAAAGSGKTAVLVERIITRLTKDASPIDVDQLLVVTFTEAAASEMKERIRGAIEKALEEHPENVHLQRQATLVHHAQVTTIHSFCLSVIRDYFHTIDLNPGFRIGEEGELKLLKRDTVEELLEERYQENTPDFLRFVESFATGKDDKKLEELILQLYEYSRSYPDPKAWLERCKKQYQLETAEEFEACDFVKSILKEIESVLNDLEENLKYGLAVCNEEDGPAPYEKALESDLQVIQKLRRAKSFSEMQQMLNGLKWDRMSACRGKDISESKKEIVKMIHDEVKKTIGKLAEDYFAEEVESILQDMRSSKSNMEVLAKLAEDFAVLFAEKKEAKNMIDFSDMEHYALRILTTEQDGNFQPSAVAKEYQEKFKEIMIDEYQDSNFIQEAILTSVSTMSKGQYNVFMVGDVKQSIYRFRLSRPELFMEKYDTYTTEDGKMQRIDLHKNFRSRREVLDSTNFIFYQIMQKDFGGIAYDEKAALYVGASYEEHPGNETEVYLIDTDDLAVEENKRELEARFLARRIKQMVGQHEVVDKVTGQYRKVRYSDIVILTRSLLGWTDVFLRTLTQEGIPAYSVSKEGYFETREIKMVLDYLRILDNPKQDIPFAAILASPFANLTSEELARIKNETEGKCFYDRVCAYQISGESNQLKTKLEDFLQQYEMFRKKVPYTAIHTLLWELMDETGYGDYIAALPGGTQRTANLEMLIEKAIQFESTSYKGLFHFVRYIEQLRKYDVDYGEASIIDEASDVVKLMSIHKSKGLEFPIVFVAGMEKMFNMQDSKGSIVIHSELGVGLDAVDLETRTKTPTLLKRMIQREEQKENAAEELRILYVAMTRAKEKLILTGTVSNLEKRLRGYGSLGKREERVLPYMRRVKARKYFDWILPALYRNQAMDAVLEEVGISTAFTNPLYREKIPMTVHLLHREDLAIEDVLEHTVNEVTKQMLQNWDTETLYDAGMRKQLEEQFTFVYPYESDSKMKPKMSVSELKKQIYLEAEEIEEEEVIPLLPKFMQEETEMTGASRGTAYHKVMELLDFSKTYTEEDLERELQRMQESGLLTSQMRECILVSDILSFLESSAGKRMHRASENKCLYAEQPFVLGEETEHGETTLVQGIIDVYFEEDEELVVLDYKTDKVWRAQELVERYKVQLEYYAKALERVTGKRVKEKIIYSFTLQKEIEV